MHILTHLEKPSVQDRYARNQSCVWADIFKDGHLNDWQIIDLVPKSGSNPEEIDQTHVMVLESIAARYVEEIQKGNFSPFMTSDPADGYVLPCPMECCSLHTLIIVFS
jgi:hypothetical protein